jgi:hypothetical protein
MRCHSERDARNLSRNRLRIQNLITRKIYFHLPTVTRKSLIGSFRADQVQSELLGHLECISRTAGAHAEFISRITLVKNIIDQLIQAP